VVVTRRTGESTTLARGFTYAPPETFDFNGTWVGYALAHPPVSGQARPLHSDMNMRVTVENNVVTSFTCDTVAAVFLPQPVRNGEFSLVPGGVPITGRIVSANEVIGTIDIPACPATLWYASRP
jgi:hypothetical protein